MGPPGPRRVLQHIDLDQVPHPAKKQGIKRHSGPSANGHQHPGHHPEQRQVPAASNPRLTEKGRAWAQEMANKKAAHERRLKNAEAKNQLQLQDDQGEEREDNGSEYQHDHSDNEAGDTEDEDEDEDPEDPLSLIQTQFVIKNTTSHAMGTQSRSHTPHTVESSPIPPQHRHSQCTTGNKRKHDQGQNMSDDEMTHPQDERADAGATSDSESQTEEVPSKKQKGPTGDGRAKAHDYDGLTLFALKHAQVEFQVRISTVNAFPEDEAAAAWAEECWENACAQCEHTESLSARQRKLITSRTSTIRGRVKDKVVSKLVSHYGFKPGSKPLNIEHNKKVAERLLKDDGYIYEELETFKGIYDHPILQDVINDQWFYGKKAEGIVFDASFNPIPDQVIGLVFTAVDYAVRRWASGQLVIGTTFNEAAFRDTYERHIEGIEAWRHFSDKSAKGLARQKQRLYNHGRAHSGLPVLQENDRPRFNVDNFARAEQAMADDSEDD